MLAFCGYNGFGQFGEENKAKEERFTDVLLEEEFRDKNIHLISPSWSFTAFSFEKTVILKGFLGEDANKQKSFSFEEEIVSLCTCDDLCLVLLATGRLFKLLVKKPLLFEEVRFALTLNESGPLKRSALGKPKAKDFKITHIGCGNKIRVAISDENIVYNIPNPIIQLPKHFQIKQLVCGYEHALLLNGNGDVLSWGNGLRGQLGRDICEEDHDIPNIIEALAGIKIIFISAGGWRSAALSAFGDIYIWGFENRGHFGLRKAHILGSSWAPPSAIYFPQLVDLPLCCNTTETTETEEKEISSECMPVAVYIGARHSVFKNSCGTVYVSGSNDHGQLGIESNENFIENFQKLNIKEVDLSKDFICGPWCTVVKLKSSSR